MVSISLLLHLHQPPTQFPEVLRRVTDQCYRPLVNLLSKYHKARLTINLTRSLVEQLESVGAAAEILPPLREAVGRRQVESTGTAAYHILLPKLPDSEIIRQIKLNEETLFKYLGVTGPRRGFFPPEMGIDRTSMELLGDLGFQWVIVDEGAINSKSNIKDQISKVSGESRDSREILAVVRNKELSLKLAFGVVTTVKDFLAAAKPYALVPEPALVLAMDGETFGHHQPKLMPFLEDLMKNSGSNEYQMTTVSEMINKKISENPLFPSAKIQSSTWSDDWLKWDNPANEIHQLQWELTNLAIETVQNSQPKADPPLVEKCKVQSDGVIPSEAEGSLPAQAGLANASSHIPSENQWLQARSLLDKALHSDQYWWASLRPNWHYQIVERGAIMLRETILTVPDAPKRCTLSANRLYSKITKTGLAKYGETVIV